MKKRFNYGICEWSVRARGRDFAELAARSGLDCIQLGVGEEVMEGRGLGDPQVVEEYLISAAASGITVDSLSPQFVDQYSFTMPKSEQEEELVNELIERTISLCDTFGCRSFLLPVLCRNDIIDGPSFHRAVEYIKRYSTMAAEKGIVTCLELNQNAEQVWDLLDAVDLPSVKIYFDSQNLYAFKGTSMVRWFRELESVIGGVHLKDGIGPMLSGSLLGEGTSGFYKTAEAIRNSSYHGSLIIESVYAKPTVCPLGSEEELLAKEAALLHRIFD